MSDIEYDQIAIPEDKSPDEYHYTHRRSEILRLVREAGHPGAINQSDLASRYGCSQPTIHNDLTVLSEYVDNSLGGRRALITEAVFHKSIRELQAEDEWRAAAQTVKDWNDWVDNHHELEEMDERLTAIEERQERAKYR